MSKDLSVVIENFQKSVMGDKGPPKLWVYGTNIKKIDVIPWRIRELDEASGIGGIPRGRIVEIFGPESSGKSWLAMKGAASAQQMDLKAGWLDVEFSFVPDWAVQHGIQLDKLVFGNEFDCGEECLMYLLEICKKRVLDYVVLDSIAALIPKTILEHTLKENTMGAAGKMMSQACSQIAQACASGGTSVVFINQVRSKVGVMFGDPETTPGGAAVKFYAGQRIRTWRKSVEMNKALGIPFRAISNAKWVKNKLAMPFRRAEYIIEFDSNSTDPVLILVRQAVAMKMFTKKRKNPEFIFGSGATGEPTGCNDIVDLGGWVKTGDRVESLRVALVALAKEKGERIDPVLESALPEVAVPFSAEGTPEADEKPDVPVTKDDDNKETETFES